MERRPFRGSVIDSHVGAAGRWYRIGFDGGDDRWVPDYALFLDSAEQATAVQATAQATAIAESAPVANAGCAGCNRGGDEQLLTCARCCTKTHSSCMNRLHVSARIWEDASGCDETEQAGVWQYWLCAQCLHPVPLDAAAWKQARVAEQEGGGGGGGGVAAGFAPDICCDDICCECCGRFDDDEWMVLCDGCDAGFHCYCLDPKLEHIPDGHWNCPGCVEAVGGTEVEADRLDVAAVMDQIVGAVIVEAIDMSPPAGTASLVDEHDRKSVESCLQRVVAAVQRASWRASLKVGVAVDAQDCNRDWLHATVSGRREGGRVVTAFEARGNAGRHCIPHEADADGGVAVLVHFSGWSADWDEWIPALSDRVQPAGDVLFGEILDPISLLKTTISSHHLI